jgi:hypothetical protein
VPTDPGDEAWPRDLDRALLYAAGRLSPVEAQAFEQRLAEDQGARDVLCRAVELAHSLAGREPAAPRPAYRERVRQRLGNRRDGSSLMERPSATAWNEVD